MRTNFTDFPIFRVIFRLYPVLICLILPRCGSSSDDSSDADDSVLAAAKTKVKTEVIAPLKEGAYANKGLLAIAHPTVLPAGANLKVPVEGELTTIEVAKESHLILLDLAPAQRFDHPVQIILAPTDGSALVIADHTALPLVDDVELFNKSREVLGSKHRFHPETLDKDNLPPTPPWVYESTVDPEAGLRHWLTKISNKNFGLKTLCPPEKEKKVAVVVASGPDEYIQEEAADMSLELGTHGFTSTLFNTEDDEFQGKGAPSKSTALLKLIKEKAAGLGDCDKFMLYITSHMFVRNTLVDGKKQIAPAIRFSLAGENLDFRHNIDAETLTDVIAGITAGHVNLMVDACYAESFYFEMSKATLNPGTTYNFFLSSKWNKTSGAASWASYFEHQFFAGSYHSAYTKVFYADFDAKEIDTNGDNWDSIAEIEKAMIESHKKTVSLEQMPEFRTLSGPTKVCAESEPNNTVDTPTSMINCTNGSGELASADDLDHFIICLEAGEYTITVTSGNASIFSQVGDAASQSGASPQVITVPEGGANVVIGFYGDAGAYTFGVTPN